MILIHSNDLTAHSYECFVNDNNNYYETTQILWRITMEKQNGIKENSKFHIANTNKEQRPIFFKTAMKANIGDE